MLMNVRHKITSAKVIFYYVLTAGIAAKNFTNEVRNLGLFIVMIALSITVAFWIIQMSDTERRIKEAAIATRRADSALSFFGTKIPKKD